MWNKGNQQGQEWFGVHEEKYKFIETYGADEMLLSEEGYHLEEDPNEQNPIDSTADLSELRSLVSDFRSRFDYGTERQHDAGLDTEVGERLRELGYR
jgi:hypothetical protein